MSGKANPTWVYFKRLDKFMGHHQTRYGRRRGTRIKKQNEEEDGDDDEEEETRDSGHSISIASVQSSCDLDLLQLGQNGGYANYRDDLMNIIANQLEVQRQSLVVQEKVITLMRTIVANSVGEVHVPKTETE